MALRVYNYLNRKKEIFKPIKGKKVGLYTCGPTVYDKVHIGNLRTYIFEDVLVKTLINAGYKTKHVMNITDIEDKIITKMKNEKKSLKQITLPYTKAFLGDIKKLNIKKANYLPKATEHIKEMISIVERLLEKGLAYKGEDGSIYFDIGKFKKYGSLSRLQKKDIKYGTRVGGDEYDKKSAGDFVLWKVAKENEPSWKSSFGEGRPGWHIECSAMSIKYLGETFDIHAGAVDLLFPHHENEIAQSEGFTGKKFVNYWVEGEHLLVDNKKMAKSLGNFYTLLDIEKGGFPPLAFRYLVLNTHYRSKLNFTWEGLTSAKEALENIRESVSKIHLSPLPRSLKKEKEYKEKFNNAISNDLNTPQSLAVIWTMIKDPKTPQSSKVKLAVEFDKILGLGLEKGSKIPPEIKKMALEREKLRKRSEWSKSDKIRSKIEKKGWFLEDTPLGARLWYK